MLSKPWRWQDHWPEHKFKVTEPPDFSGLDPETGEPWMPSKIVKILGLKAVTDTDEIKQACEAVLADNPGQVEDYRKGKTKVIGFFIKQVLDRIKGADPKSIKQTLEELLVASV